MAPAQTHPLQSLVLSWENGPHPGRGTSTEGPTGGLRTRRGCGKCSWATGQPGSCLSPTPVTLSVIITITGAAGRQCGSPGPLTPRWGPRICVYNKFLHNVRAGLGSTLQPRPPSWRVWPSFSPLGPLLGPPGVPKPPMPQAECPALEMRVQALPQGYRKF